MFNKIKPWLRFIGTVVSFAAVTACGGGGSSSISSDTGGNAGGSISPVASNTAPTGMRLIEVSSSAIGAINASWLAASDDTTPAAAIKYEVHASLDASFVPVAGTADTLKFQGAGVSSALVTTGLQNGKKYTVRILAIDQNGASATSEPLQATVADTAAAGVPGASVSNLQANQIASVNTSTVVLNAGVTPPAVGQFISSATANEGKGYLRKVTAVGTASGAATLQTEPASVNEVIKDIQISSSFKMDTIPNEVINTTTKNVTQKSLGNNNVETTHSWPETGLRYQTSAQYKAASANQKSANPKADTSQKTSNNVSISGDWGKVSGNNRVELIEGASDQLTLRLDITDNSKPWNSSTPVALCKVTLGSVNHAGTGAPAKLQVTTGSFSAITTVEGNRITAANQTINFKALAGSAAGAAYTVKATAYLDDAGDGCSGTSFLTWREQIEFDLEVFVITDNLPTDEVTEKVFQGSAGFSVTNKITTTFAPKVEFDKTLNGSRLTYARLAIKASPRLEQSLLITATGQGTMDKTSDIIAPRKFFKTYITPSGIPIVVSGELTLKVRITGSVNGALTASQKLTIGYDDLSAGLEYSNGIYTPIKSATPVYNLRVAGQGKAQADLTISLLPGIELTGYEILTGKAVLEPYINAAAGVEGHVRLDQEIDFNAYQANAALDADFRLTQARLGGGINAWLYADLHLWDVQLAVYPANAVKANYTTFKKVELIADTAVASLPTLAAAVDPAGTHPSDSRAIKINLTATNLPNPLRSLFNSLPDSYIKWARWTNPRIIAPLGTQADSYYTVPNPAGTPTSPTAANAAYVVMTKSGTYTVRVGGHSSWGSWARQYTEVQVVVADANANGIPDWWEQRYGLTGTGAAIASADPDGDGRTNLQEWQDGTNPTVADGPPVSTLPNQAAVVSGVFADSGSALGPVPAGGSTGDTTPLVAGTVNARLLATQVIRIYDGANTIVAVVGSAGLTTVGGTWTTSILPAQALSVGPHTLTARVASADGLLGPPSPGFSFTVLGSSTATVTTTVTTSNLTDTGIGPNQCYEAGSNVLVSCSSAGALALNNHQDGMRGRDVTSPDNSDGTLGFSYTKLSATGAVLPASASVWSCVRDNITGKIWENKTLDGSPRDALRTFTNYDSPTSLQINGTTAPTAVQINAIDNTVGYVNYINTANLCGYIDWRLPTVDELQTTVDYGAYIAPVIDAAWFGNTSSGFFWSSSFYVGYADVAWNVDFSYGGVGGGYRNYTGYVRLVRAGQ